MYRYEHEFRLSEDVFCYENHTPRSDLVKAKGGFRSHVRPPYSGAQVVNERARVLLVQFLAKAQMRGVVRIARTRIVYC